jgi:hypothetical protein
MNLKMKCTAHPANRTKLNLYILTTGTSNFKLEAIKQHENSKAHLLYVHKLESINKPKTSKVSQRLLQLK